jgi:hypothetical protein
MIVNVIDNRRRPYRWKEVKAAIEPAWHDNKCNDADQAVRGEQEVDYQERDPISIEAAIAWATDLPFPVTLYLSDASRDRPSPA